MLEDVTVHSSSLVEFIGDAASDHGGLAPAKTGNTAAPAVASPSGVKDGSRPPTPGILKKSKDNSLSGSRKSRLLQLSARCS